MSTMASMITNYAINLSGSEVQLMDNRVVIKKDGWKGLTTKELDHDDVVYALRKGWIKLTATKPSTPEDPVPTKPGAPERPIGKSLEEVKAEKKK